MNLLLCPICGETPDERESVVKCCELIAYSNGSCERWMASIWNNMVIEYRKMIALEKIANNQPLYFSYPSYPMTTTPSDPMTTTPSDPMTTTITYDKSGKSI